MKIKLVSDVTFISFLEIFWSAVNRCLYSIQFMVGDKSSRVLHDNDPHHVIFKWIITFSIINRLIYISKPQYTRKNTLYEHKKAFPSGKQMIGKKPPRFLLTICNCIVKVSKNVINLFQHDKRSETVWYAFVAFVSAFKKILILIHLIIDYQKNKLILS